MLKNKFSLLVLLIPTLIVFSLYIYLSKPLYQITLHISKDRNEIIDDFYTEPIIHFFHQKYSSINVTKETFDESINLYIASPNRNELEDLGHQATHLEIKYNKNLNLKPQSCDPNNVGFDCFLDNLVSEKMIAYSNAITFLQSHKIEYEIKEIRPKPVSYVFAFCLLYAALFLIFNKRNFFSKPTAINP